MADSKQEKDASSSSVNGGETTGGGDRPSRRAEKRGKKPRRQTEIGGPKGPEPTRYGDWERKGIASDF